MVAELYQLKITATGEVRDADGNLVEQKPIEATAVLTEAEAAVLLAQQEDKP